MIIYGVQRIFIQEIDPETSLPPTDGGLSFLLHCTEELSWEPVMEDAVETTKRCPSDNSIMGNRRIPESLYGYTITLTENEWNIDLHAFLNGMTRVPGGAVIPSDAAYIPPITEGLQFPPFRLIAFSANYEGAEVLNYAVWVFNRCNGTVSSVDLSDDFAQFEYTIEVREATVAGLPLHSIGRYDSTTPPDSLDDIIIESGIIVQPTEPAGRMIQVGRSNANQQGIAMVTNKETNKES